MSSRFSFFFFFFICFSDHIASLATPVRHKTTSTRIGARSNKCARVGETCSTRRAEHNGVTAVAIGALYTCERKITDEQKKMMRKKSFFSLSLTLTCERGGGGFTTTVYTETKTGTNGQPRETEDKVGKGKGLCVLFALRGAVPGRSSVCGAVRCEFTFATSHVANAARRAWRTITQCARTQAVR